MAATNDPRLAAVAPPCRKRLAQKLLRGSAVAAAVADATLAESEARRDKFGNRW